MPTFNIGDTVEVTHELIKVANRSNGFMRRPYALQEPFIGKVCAEKRVYDTSGGTNGRPPQNTNLQIAYVIAADFDDDILALEEHIYPVGQAPDPSTYTQVAAAVPSITTHPQHPTFTGIATPVSSPTVTDVTEDIVVDFVNGRQSFTAYNVTEAVRKMMPTVNVRHAEVKTLVHLMMSQVVAQGSYERVEESFMGGTAILYRPL